MSAPPLLSVEGLRTVFFAKAKGAFVRAVDGVDLSVAAGETLGIVGESGSGKTVAALSALGLPGGSPGVVAGRAVFRPDGEDVDLLPDPGDFVTVVEAGGEIVRVAKDEEGFERAAERLAGRVRGRGISVVFQNPKGALNPFLTVGEQIAEAVRIRFPETTEAQARERALRWLARVRMDDPAGRLDAYPRGLSGGMCQRAMIALALSAEPRLVIADEPTTGLDATIQARIADLLEELGEGLRLATVLISHDIALVRRLAGRAAIMYAGQVVEEGPAGEVLRGAGGHPYTEALLAAVPTERLAREKGRLSAIPGDVPDPARFPAGCRFRERCRRIDGTVRRRCETLLPPLFPVAPGRRVRCWLFEPRGGAP